MRLFRGPPDPPSARSADRSDGAGADGFDATAAEVRRPRLYGLLAEFEDGSALIAATRRAWADGYRAMDAFSPFPVEGLADALGFHRSAIPTIGLVGGIIGGVGGFALQSWVAGVAYPINVGGRPLISVPAFVPVTFEMTILFAALAGVLGMLALDGLPHPYHPAFNVPSFGRATRDGFFLLIEASDPRFHQDRTRRYLLDLGAREVQDVRP